MKSRAGWPLSKLSRWLLAACALLLAACAEPIDPRAYPAAPLTGDRPSSPPAELSFSVIATGMARSLDAFAFQGGSWLQSRIFSHAAILVRHPDGDLLFDTGLGTEIEQQFAADMPSYLKPLMEYSAHKPALQQLQDAGYEPRDIKRVYVSHLHWDHASGIKDFSWARIYLAREELAAARDPANADVYLPSQVDGDMINWNNIEFVAEPYMGYARSHDVYGDGSVVLVPIPGHTPGGIGMFLTLADGRRFLFSGDLSWSLEGIEIPAEKFLIASMIVDRDRDQTRAQLVHAHRLIQRYPELQVVPAHDYAVHERLGFFPAEIRARQAADQ